MIRRQYHSDRSHHEYSVNLGRIHYVGSVYSVPGGIASGAEALTGYRTSLKIRRRVEFRSDSMPKSEEGS
jgi:hypothetical protein